MMNRQVVIACCGVVIWGLLGAARWSAAHEEDEKQPAAPGPNSEAAAPAAVASLPPALVLPAFDGGKPWSEKPQLNHPDRFQIAIMSDRTGGHRPGIWEKAVERVNLLRPEFVISVGDLIEGYSDKPEEAEAEWKEFLGFIDRLEMKFFFVAGNHDLNNPYLHRVWREKFGAEWYSFDYKRVHFVCLSTEDPAERIGDGQLAWLADDLARHQDARWTLLFMHRPLWTIAEREIAAGKEDPTNWKQVEKLLGSRPHTVFAGHVHHYVQYDRGGMKYYHLGTTGGSSALRGLPFGEFDHVTWLTMEPDGPHVAHLLLEGILAGDAVTEEGIARFREFLARTTVEVAPILVRDAAGLSQGRIAVRLANGFSRRVEMTGRIEGLPLRGLSLASETLSLAADPGETATLALDVQFASPVEFASLARTTLTARLAAVGEERPMRSERSVPVIIDQAFDCSRARQQVVLDGELSEWEPLLLSTGEQPFLLGNKGAWNGVADGAMRLAAAHDDRFLYLAAQITDENVLLGEDRWELRLDGRPIAARKNDPRLGGAACRIRLGPAAAPSEQFVVEAYPGSKPPVGAAGCLRRTFHGYQAEVAIPLDFLKGAQGGEWETFQLSAALRDVDATGEEPTLILWRGSDLFDRSNVNYGQFVRRQ